jgi:protein-tyrosine-phosphatase
MAEVLLRRRLDERGVLAHVGSAGFLEVGLPAMDDAIATMAESGYDLSGHRSRIVSVDMVNQADLVIAMSHEHAIELGVMAADAWSKFFQIRDFLRRVDSTGLRHQGSPFSVWLEVVGGSRTRAEFLTANRGDDIADPVGQPRQQYDQTKFLLDELTTKLAAVLS